MIKKVLRLFLCAIAIASIFNVTAAIAAVTCDGVHVHAGDFSGMHIPCDGSVWQDSGKVYIQGGWSTNCAVNYSNIETNNDRCSEWEWHYNNVPSNITWYANWACNLDYDSGEKHVDLHSTYTSYAANDMTYLLAYVNVSNASIIGTGFVSQHHFDPYGWACYDQRPCINGAYYTSSGTYVDAPGEWYDDWQNGDRH